MNSPFLNNYDKINLFADITLYEEFLLDRIQQGANKKYFTNISWFLLNSLELLNEYDIDRKELNLLEDDEYQNILNTIQKIINKQYYGFTE